MKTQLSRDSFRRARRYSGVYLQQGRMITDADWNEATEIAKRRLDAALGDTVTSGVPRTHGLGIEAAAGQPLCITRGRLYADGLAAEVTGTQANPDQPFGLGQQADLPLPDGVSPPAGGYRLYADVWERVVTSHEDPDPLRDPAFHGADTASRTQTVVQLKWCTPATDPEDLAVNPPLGDARLDLTLRRQLAGLDPCDPCASEVSIPPRIGNYLFRLEVHAVEGGPLDPDRLVLKWSSENGAEQHVVGTEPADFTGSDWIYEFYTTRTEKHLGVHLPGGITPLAGSLVEGFPAVPPGGFPFVRRWDGFCELERAGTAWTLAGGRERGVDLATDTAADADGHVALAGGTIGIQLSTLTLELELAGRRFVAGDYWLAAVREAVHAPGDPVLGDGAPVGVRHHYLLLATVAANGAAQPPDTDRLQRLDFPSLTTLAARDVDYTADCPSGLFDATHDTVQKALDRVCGIDATHVGFTKPCDTSVFQGVDPAAVDTVAKALALLCDLRAAQVSYVNEPPCTTLIGVTNVQEALHRLCLRESSSGCRATIGEGGDFPTLVDAVGTLLGRGDTRLVFCLLPGDHDVAEDLTVTPEAGQILDLDLEGCGPASRLRIEKALSLVGLRSVHLHDLAIELAPSSTLKIGGGEEVMIDRCTVRVADHDSTVLPITLGASRLVRLADDDLRATSTEQLTRKGGEVFGDEPVLRDLFRERLAAADRTAALREASVAVAGLSRSRRRALSAAIQPRLDDLDLTELQRSALREISILLTADTELLQPGLERALGDLRAALLEDATAPLMVIEHEGGNATLTDNHMVGELSIYGPSGDLLRDSELGILRGRIGEGLVQLQAAEECLFLTRNRLSRLRIGGDLVERFREVLGDGGTVTGLFRTARLTENVFTRGANELACVEADLTANRFAQSEAGEGFEGRFIVVIAQTAFYVGNHGAENGFVQDVSARFNIQTAQDLNAVFIHDIH